MRVRMSQVTSATEGDKTGVHAAVKEFQLGYLFTFTFTVNKTNIQAS